MFWHRFSLVWIIPVVALAVALSLAWQSYSERGVLIEIEFRNGANIKPRETQLRFRDVPVGTVEAVRFNDDLSAVIVGVRVERDIAPFIDAAASFWIVEPELTVQGVSGLDTVLSGVYIEGAWDDKIGAPTTRFRGMRTAPLFRAGEPGLQIALRTVPGGGLTDNSPITHRGIEVGRVGKAQISGDGEFAIAEAIIFEPHTNLISDRTRFWDTSGFSFSVGADGAKIEFSSLATLVSGGITFDTFVSGGAPVTDGTVFFVHPDEGTARDSLFNENAAEPLELRVFFDENVAGLAVDSPVELNGLRIGKVENVTGIIDPEVFGDNRVRLSVLLAIQPARLGLQGDVSSEAALDFMRMRVEQGLRARLASASLLIRGLKVEFVEVPDAPPATLQPLPDGPAVMPTTQSEITDASASVEGVFNRINNLPVEELLGSAIDFLDSAQALFADEDLRETPADIRALVAGINEVVTSEDLRRVPAAINTALTQFETLLAEFSEQELAGRLGAAVDAAGTASADVSGAVAGIPELVAELESVAAKANDLPLEVLADELTAVLASADAILAAETTRALPADLSAALEGINTTLEDLRAGGTVENVNAALASARRAADALAISAEDLPALVARAQEVLARADATIAGYDRGEALSREARTTLRDISKAAEALRALARMLERNPGAIIRGR